MSALFAPPAQAQAPGLLWTTNLGAKVFAVDAQTNVYANAGGTVIKLDAAGVPLQTNVICPTASLTQRDAAGNYYFAGTVTAPDSGGIMLTGYCFLAKYTGSGSLVWATDFGPQTPFRAISVGDLQLDGEGNCYVGYTYNVFTWDHSSLLAKFNASGSNTWTIGPPRSDRYSSASGSVRLGGISATNGFVTTYLNPGFGSWAVLSGFDINGTTTVLANWESDTDLARPTVNASGELYSVEGRASQTSTQVTKRGPSGTVIWNRDNGYTPSWVAGPDQYGGVHVARNNSQLSRYDSDGNQIWTLGLPVNCTAMVLDAQGNRFISLANGAVARVGDEPVSIPAIINAPQGQTVLAGSNVVFTVGASGSTPLRYYWLYQNNVIAGPTTNATLSLANVTPAQAGSYSVIVSNFLGSVTSSPALLRVKSVALFVGSQILTNGTYSFPTPPTLSIRSAFPNGSVFYTLDGSAPDFSSTSYSGAFTLSQSATVRAIGYSADFMQSEEADAAIINVLVNHTLSASASGGGSVSLDPPGGTYVSTNVVTATAVPATGWSFLYWLGDASDTNPAVAVSMERDKSIRAVFGTTLSTTVAGNGQVLLDPPGGVYPCGAVVRLTGLPQSGSYFGAWGNAASGSANPLYFTVTNPNPTVSSIFGATPADKASLAVVAQGHGRVNATPSANLYNLGQSVTLTAAPDPGQSFVGWGGDATGAQNPLTLSMTQSKVITATFSSQAQMKLTQGLDGLTPDGFRLTLVSDPQQVWQILGSTNLSTWENLGTVTNVLGEVQFTDPAAAGKSMRFYRAVPGQ